MSQTRTPNAYHRAKSKSIKRIGIRIEILRATEDQMQESIRMYHQEERFYPIDLNDSIKSIDSISDIESKLPIALYIYLYFFRPCSSNVRYF
jgi:hypothetical protein